MQIYIYLTRNLNTPKLRIMVIIQLIRLIFTSLSTLIYLQIGHRRQNTAQKQMNRNILTTSIQKIISAMDNASKSYWSNVPTIYSFRHQIVHLCVQHMCDKKQGSSLKNQLESAFSIVYFKPFLRNLWKFSDVSVFI